MDRLDAMATLVEVVAARNFAAAGRNLRLSRAVVSKQVQQLETEFGARFFHRSTRRISLTDAGARFHQHCLAILAAVKEATDDVDERSGQPRGVLRMTAPSAFTELHLMEPLQRFAHRYPSIELDLDCSERFVDLVREGFDVGVRICASPPPGLIAKKLASSSMVICGSPEYVRERGRPTRPEDLGKHECLGWIYQSHATSWDLVGGSTVRIRPRHRTNHNGVLRRLALAGEGLAQLPSYFVAADLAEGRLVPVLERYRDTSRSVFVIYPSRTQLSPRVRALIDHLAACFTRKRW